MRLGRAIVSFGVTGRSGECPVLIDSKGHGGACDERQVIGMLGASGSATPKRSQ